VRASQETPVPAAVGLWSPAILIPSALLDQLSPADLDRIVLHEWAHIRRRDNWTNFAQELLQAVLFFHPAVWCIGRSLGFERELACDDSVVSATGEPVPYAGCLARLVELNSCPPVSLSPGAAGDARDLFHRVERLLHWNVSSRFSARGFAAACLLLLAGALAARQTPAVVNIPAPTLALHALHPAIEASRQALVSEDRIRTANILLETAEQRLASANRMMRAARQQVRLAEQIAQAAPGAPVSRVACQQPAAPPAAPNMNKI
jgi:Zn-dependent protease with chaperone function